MGRVVLFFLLISFAMTLPSLGIAEEILEDPAKAWERGYQLWLYISVVIWLTVMIPLIWFSFKYKRKKPTRDVDGEYIKGNAGLEILWTAIPTIIVIVLAVQTWTVFDKLRRVPEDAYTVKVEGYQFGFDMNYPEEGTDDKGDSIIKTTNELIVPQGPVRVMLTSRDVIHSFYVPHFKTKEDMIPGRWTYIYMLAKDPGTYPVYCAEYCGASHSLMLAKVIVKPKEDFKQWASSKTKAAAMQTPEQRGAELIKACLGCHNVTGEPGGIGPSLKGIVGHQTEFEDGTSAVVDEAYLKESIVNPNAKIVKGYPAAMPPYASMPESDINAIISYLKTLK